ncbi:MAG: membrane protein insertion efficiency factor YidD [Bacteroidetes bacterium]|nr:membrane protein insertion efficiency factor YidD [Bacteroidota bacterium]
MKHNYKIIFINPIKLYKKIISPMLPNSCRFYPTCSEYMMLAIEKYGALHGILKGIHRILRCNPFCKGGIEFP